MKLRKQVNNSIKMEKRDYILATFDQAANNPVKFWNAVAEIIPSKKSSPNLEGVFCPTSNDFCKGTKAADIFNRFFAESCQQLNAKLPEKSRDFPLTTYSCVMTVMPIVDLSFVEYQLDQIDVKKSSGLSSINARLLKSSCQSIRFCKLLNLCITNAIFPLQWKISTIVPLPKKGDVRYVTNLRPVALLPVPGKILEKYLVRHLSNYLEDCQLLSPCQGGFRRGHSTQLSAFKLCDEIFNTLNNNHCSLVTYLDVAKAFNIHNLILDYVDSRQQRVNFNGDISSRLPVTGLCL